MPLEARLVQVFRLAVGHWLGLLVLASATFATLPLAAPILAMTGHETSSSWIYIAYRATCHQLPHHSWFLGGRSHTYDWETVAGAAGVDPAGPELELMHTPLRDPELGYQMAFCERDTAIHLAFFVTAVSFAAVRRRPGPLPWRVYGLAIVPIAVDGLTQLGGFRQSTPELRTITGALFGAATALLVLPHLDAGFRDILSTPSDLPAVVPSNPSFRLVLGTHNRAKRAEISSVLLGLAHDAEASLELVMPEDVGFDGDIAETEPTFEQNSIAKARAYHVATGLPVIADDGGLEIVALGGAPGVRSRRWLGDDAESTDEALIAYTLARLQVLDRVERAARLRTCLTFYDGQSLHQECAAVDGHIATSPSPRRTAGYPYRSLFVVGSLGKFYDELTEAEHALVNHREMALRTLFDSAILPAVRLAAATGSSTPRL